MLTVPSQQRTAGVTDFEPVSYGAKTTTSVIRNHLFYAHADTWIEACDKMKITIGGKDAFQAKITAYRAKNTPGANAVPVDARAEPVPEFSQEALIDAIADLVIVDDLVSPFNSSHETEFFDNNPVH